MLRMFTDTKCGEGTAAVDMGGAENLGLDSVAGIARAEHFSLGLSLIHI